LRLAGDERLVALVREESEAAFEAIYDRYHQPLLSFCRHMLGNADDAAEAVQHAFVAAYSDITTSEKQIRLRAWLFTIARNRCISVLRRRREQVEVELADLSIDGLAAQVQRREDLRDLLADLAELPNEQRAALVLAELNAVDHEEIGQILGCRREKVKALVFQARSALLANREAREIPCREIREQLSILTGGALRRRRLTRHLRQCPDCRAFRDAVRRQRKALALLLPVASEAGLKQTVISAIGSGDAGATATTGGFGTGVGVSAAGFHAGAVKALVAVAIVAGGATGASSLGDVGGSSAGPKRPPAGATRIFSHAGPRDLALVGPSGLLKRLGAATNDGATRLLPGARRGHAAASHPDDFIRRNAIDAASAGSALDHGKQHTQGKANRFSGASPGRSDSRGSSHATPKLSPSGHAHARPGSKAPRNHVDHVVSPSPGSTPTPSGHAPGNAAADAGKARSQQRLDPAAHQHVHAGR
jgi:RNA polymerase sigma factor (sigma-70 family)